MHNFMCVCVIVSAHRLYLNLLISYARVRLPECLEAIRTIDKMEKKKPKPGSVTETVLKWPTDTVYKTFLTKPPKLWLHGKIIITYVTRWPPRKKRRLGVLLK